MCKNIPDLVWQLFSGRAILDGGGVVAFPADVKQSDKTRISTAMRRGMY